jgi:hypothetical protein
MFLRVVPPEDPDMLGLLGLIFTAFAVMWAGIAAVLGVVVIFVFVLPLLVLAVLFRAGFALIKLTAVLVLICLASVWLI